MTTFPAYISLQRAPWLRAVAAVLLACAAALASAHEAGPVPIDARQMLVVVTDDWTATTGALRAFARHDATAPWTAVDDAMPVSVGRSGLGWGRGLHPAQADGPRKAEGDGRAPAGVFAIGTAFGYADHAATALDYLALQRAHWCIDVPDAPLYNRIVDSRDTGEAAIAGSTEPMRRDLYRDGDPRYRQGFVILHNPDAHPGAGSCIFAHLWQHPGEPTAGCTAMDATDMRNLLAWLDAAHHPVVVALPRAEYARLRTAWMLPPLD